MTVREVYEKLVVSKGHRQLIGTAAEVADDLQEWFEQGGADGFNVMPAQMPDGLNDFAEFVIPELAASRAFQNGLRRHDASAAPRRAEPGLGRCLACQKRKGRDRQLELRHER